ncbi:IS21 family transposase [Corallococcus interemptor]|uniref:IS21 family transposase n=1 Tax=Corallococcus interemptor TaxID=2316720 RepID=A0A3A8Q7J9_9BACT|nr:IS21 family transposase [Corallococcus interemptor]RKH64636.1 IS21 family transposase [Corallococcus interemptor]
MDRLRELVRLHRMGTGAREVARLLGMGPNTERTYRAALSAAGVLEGPEDEVPELEVLKALVQVHLPSKLPPQQTSSLVAWQQRVETLLGQGVGARAIHDRLRLEVEGFAASYSAVKRMVRQLRKAQGVRAEEVAIPVITAPGEVAQVDFGYVGQLQCPRQKVLRKAWVFVLVLAHSRYLVADVVFEQSLPTWLRLHVEAFEQLGGVVETVVPDNLKAAVLRAAFTPDVPSALNRSYREVARHYGFKVDPTPPYAPQKKGKVEAGVKYVQSNFFKGRQGQDVDVVRADLKKWLAQVANVRRHGKTGRRPVDVFGEEELPALRPLPTRRFTPVVWKPARVHQDSHVLFDRRFYSVPWRLVGSDVWLRVTEASLEVYADDVRVATHARRGTGLYSTCEEHLPQHRADLRHRSRGYWEARAAQLGEKVLTYVRAVFDSDEVLSQLRAVQAIVTHLEGFPPERARAAARRAHYYGTYSYGGLKNLLRQGLDLQPLPLALAAPATSSLPQPRFARSVAELLHHPAVPQEPEIESH